MGPNTNADPVAIPGAALTPRRGRSLLMCALRPPRSCTRCARRAASGRSCDGPLKSPHDEGRRGGAWILVTDRALAKVGGAALSRLQWDGRAHAGLGCGCGLLYGALKRIARGDPGTKRFHRRLE